MWCSRKERIHTLNKSQYIFKVLKHMKKMFKQKTSAVEQDTAVSAQQSLPGLSVSPQPQADVSFNTSHRPAFSAAAVCPLHREVLGCALPQPGTPF